MKKDFWKNRRVLITGANGFLAGWLAKDIIERGAVLTALNYQKNPISIFETEKLHQSSNVIFGDILDFAAVKQNIQENDIQTVFHLGAQAICKTALADPVSTLDTNIRGTINVLEAVRVINPDIEIVVASSDKAYGIHENLPYYEHFPLRGEFPYEVSKTCADLISQMYHKTYGLNVCIVRSGNLYGGGDAHFSRIFPNTIRRLHADMAPVLVSNGIRDYLYVEDAAHGYVMIAENIPALKGEAFNIGCGRQVSVVEVMEMIAETMNKSHIKPTSAGITMAEIPSQYLSSEKIKNMVGWEPTVDLKEGIARTVQWYSDWLNTNTMNMYND
jgi:CDP-glucose 4,6-dehydratase